MLLMMVFLFTSGTRTLGFARDTVRSQAQMTGSVEMMKQAGWMMAHKITVLTPGRVGRVGAKGVLERAEDKL